MQNPHREREGSKTVRAGDPPPVGSIEHEHEGRPEQKQVDRTQEKIGPG